MSKDPDKAAQEHVAGLFNRYMAAMGDQIMANMMATGSVFTKLYTRDRGDDWRAEVLNYSDVYREPPEPRDPDVAPVMYGYTVFQQVNLIWHQPGLVRCPGCSRGYLGNFETGGLQVCTTCDGFEWVKTQHSIDPDSSRCTACGATEWDMENGKVCAMRCRSKCKPRTKRKAL